MPNYPHEPACACCRSSRVCNVCGSSITQATRCTNGRCTACHDHCCTPGGDTSPGHGFGSRQAAEWAAKAHA